MTATHMPRVLSRNLSYLGILSSLLFFSNFINLANYSFLTYTFGGFAYSNPIAEIVKLLRLPVLLFGAVICLLYSNSSAALRSYYKANWDLVTLAVAIYFGLVNSVNFLSGLSYSIWHSAALLGIITYFYFLPYNPRTAFLQLLRLTFWSNFIVIPLLFLRLDLIREGWGFEMAFSSKAFYPYCLVAILLSLYAARSLCRQSIFPFDSPWQCSLSEYFIIASCIFFSFLGARRGPLAVILVATTLYFYYAVGDQVWKKLTLATFAVLAVLLVKPFIDAYVSEHALEFRILKKISDVQETGGDLSKESSYHTREVIWEQYGDIISDHPIAGVGSFNGAVYHENRFRNTTTAGYSTHNLFFGTLVEHGYIGLLLLLLVIFRSILIAVTHLKFSAFTKFFLFLTIPVLVINWNEYNLIPGQVFYWFTMLTLLAPRILLR